MAEIGQVLDRELYPLAVVRGRRWKRPILGAAVYEHERHAGVGDLVEQLVVEPGGCGDETVHLPGPHRPEDDAFALGIVLGAGDHRRVARLIEPVLDAADDGREERVLDVRDENANRVRTVGLQPARDRIWVIAELIGRLDDAL